MKILHVIEGMDPKYGGVCEAVRTIAAGLTTEGVYNEVASLDSPDVAFIGNGLVTIHKLGPAKSAWKYSNKLIPWLINNLNRFDIIIVHGLWLYPSFALNKVIKTIKRRVVSILSNEAVPKLFIMPHGMLDPYFQKASGRKLKAIRNWFYWKLIENEVITNADALLFTCITEMELARESFRPYLPKKEMVVGLGVQNPPESTVSMREAFLAKCPDLKHGRYLLFLGRIHPKKGVDLLLRAFELIGDKYLKNRENLKSTPKEGSGNKGFSCTEQLKIVLSGPGLNTPYGRKIKQWIDSSQFLKANVYMTGMLEGDAKWGAFYGCDAFILPSHQENFGIAVVEALACGKPVLISKQVNIWREIEMGGGCIVANDTFEGTTKTIQQWINFSKAEKDDIGLKARKIFEQDFAMEPVAKKLIYAFKN